MQRGTGLHQQGNGLTPVRRTSEAITSFNFLTTDFADSTDFSSVIEHISINQHNP